MADSPAAIDHIMPYVLRLNVKSLRLTDEQFPLVGAAGQDGGVHRPRRAVGMADRSIRQTCLHLSPKATGGGAGESHDAQRRSCPPRGRLRSARGLVAGTKRFGQPPRAYR